MLALRANSLRSGFTVLELLIVIVVIGILATLVLISYNGIQESAREKSILSDADAVQTEVTRYGTKNGGVYGSPVLWYSGGAANDNIKFTPSPGNIIDVVTTNTTYCIRTYNTSLKDYNSLDNAYQKESDTNVCLTLPPSSAAIAADPTYTGIQAPAAPELMTTVDSSTQVTVSWDAVTDATEYTIEYATSSDFASPTTILDILTTSTSVSGLTQGVTYYFRGFAANDDFTSSVSATVEATTTVTTPSPPSIIVTTPTPATQRAYLAGLWIPYAGMPTSGNLSYSSIAASESCPSGTTIQYRFGGQWEGDTEGFVNWTTGTTRYIYNPSSSYPYRVKLGVQAKCVGSNAESEASEFNSLCHKRPNSSSSGSPVGCFSTSW